MTSRKTRSASSAATFGHDGEGDLSDLRQPLLDVSNKEQSAMDEHMKGAAEFQCCSILMGMVVGLLMLLSTIGINYVSIVIWGPGVVLTKTNFWLVWCAMTSVLAMLLLAVHRHMVTAMFYQALDKEANDDAEVDRHKLVMKNMENLVLHLQGWFVAGALTGVCLAWAAFDLFLGRVNEALTTLMVFVLTLIWCRFVVFMSTTLFAWKDAQDECSSYPSADDEPLVTVV